MQKSNKFTTKKVFHFTDVFITPTKTLVECFIPQKMVFAANLLLFCIFLAF